MATANRDGRFRIDDVPAGEYSLNVSFVRNEAGHLRDYLFVVPPADTASAGQPVDLGALRLASD